MKHICELKTKQKFSGMTNWRKGTPPPFATRSPPCHFIEEFPDFLSQNANLDYIHNDTESHHTIYPRGVKLDDVQYKIQNKNI